MLTSSLAGRIERMRLQLKKLHDDGYQVDEIIVAGDVVQPNRWLYVASAQALVCGEAVAVDARALWPFASGDRPLPVVQIASPLTSPTRKPRRALAIVGDLDEHRN
jgi:hypothetical protein